MINVQEDQDIFVRLMIYINVKNGENKSLQILLIKYKKSKTEQSPRINQEHQMIKQTGYQDNYIIGGNNYRQIKNAKMYDAQGHQIPGFGGYRYFGAAKDLPGVKDVFKKQVPTAPAKTKQQIRKVIDQEYFGDSEILDEQLLREQKLQQQAKRQGQLVQWIQINKKKIQQYFKGRQPQFDQLMENIDNIEDFQVLVQQQMIQQKIQNKMKPQSQ